MFRNLLISAVTVFVFGVSQVYADTYEIDSAHSAVEFKIRHLAISFVKGGFMDFSGEFTFNPQEPGNSKAKATIKTKSIDTNQAKRDEHLLSPDFFNADKNPTIEFVSREIKDATADSFKVLGDLTINGVTKPVTLDVAYGGSTKGMQGEQRAAFSATTKLNRKDFGLTWSKVLETGALVVGEEVTVNLEIEGVKKG